MAKNEKPVELSEAEYQKRMMEITLEEQKLNNQQNQVQNMILMLKRKILSIGQELSHVQNKKIIATELFTKERAVKKLDNDEIETIWESHMKASGMEKAIDYKNDS